MIATWRYTARVVADLSLISLRTCQGLVRDVATCRRLSRDVGQSPRLPLELVVTCCSYKTAVRTFRYASLADDSDELKTADSDDEQCLSSAVWHMCSWCGPVWCDRGHEFQTQGVPLRSARTEAAGVDRQWCRSAASYSSPDGTGWTLVSPLSQRPFTATLWSSAVGQAGSR